MKILSVTAQKPDGTGTNNNTGLKGSENIGGGINPLWVIIAAVFALLSAGIVVVIILLVKNKKKEK